jgi:hypothetical protein
LRHVNLLHKILALLLFDYTLYLQPLQHVLHGLEHALDIRNLADIRLDHQRRRTALFEAESWFGNPTILLQYWRSFEHLERYAKDPDREHRPAWAAFNRAIASRGDVGIWHETYCVRAREFECIYNNMPPFGLGKATMLPQF